MGYFTTRQKGVSLLELAIGLVIIGLIVGAISIASNLRQTAAAKQIMSELGNYLQAFTQFKEIYKAKAGDMLNAADHFTGNAAWAGNGNGTWDQSQERDVLWAQLDQANIIDTNISVPVFSGTYYNTAVREVGKHRPASKWQENVGWTIVPNTSFTVIGAPSITYDYGEILRLGAFAGGSNGGEELIGNVVPVWLHRQIDAKLDVENTPLTGKYVALGNANCLSGEEYGADEDQNCTLNWLLDTPDTNAITPCDIDPSC